MDVVIRSIGAYVPEKVVSNDDLAKTMDTSDEWIKSHTGISTRHIVAEDQATSDLALAAAKIALDRSGLNILDIDLIMVATATGDYVGFPATACIVQDKLGARHAGAFDIAAGCTGFAYGLEIARGMISGGSAKNILVIGAESLTRIANWEDRDTCVLFGDGAGAAVVSAEENADGRGILYSVLRSEGNGATCLMRFAGGSRNPITDDTPRSDILLSMDGQSVYMFAVRVNTAVINTILDENNLTLDDIKYFVPHQANIRIIQAAAKRLKVPMEKFYVNIDKYANTSAASIPIALNEMHETGKLQRGDLIITLGFGAGLTYGGNLIRW
ncbi:MAG: ketoacyl-ACP synthase III [Spirochaetales bacterium]|nr:ketoacyl-ACP synthase III [Spirochaetales bacterium]